MISPSYAALAALVLVGCAAALPERGASRGAHPLVSRAPTVSLVYHGDQPFARPAGCANGGAGCEEWSLGDVRKDEMVFSPDGRRFAYVRQRPSSAWRVLVRNLAGDPVNEFAVYRPGMPDALSWLDNRHLGYVAPGDAAVRHAVFVVHDADTGEVLAARSGSEFAWSGDRRHVAFVSGAPGRQTVLVDGQAVWPRAGLTHVHGAPVWSPDGHGLAFVDEGNGSPRLVVLVEYGDPHGDLTWTIPREALADGLKVFWAGDSKVVIGESALHPRFAAGWERLR